MSYPQSFGVVEKSKRDHCYYLWMRECEMLVIVGPLSVWVCPTGYEDQFLSWEQLQRLRTEGITIPADGVHALRPVGLTSTINFPKGNGQMELGEHFPHISSDSAHITVKHIAIGFVYGVENCDGIEYASGQERIEIPAKISLGRLTGEIAKFRQAIANLLE